MNPGKIASPNDSPLLKIDEVPLRGSSDRVIGNSIRAAFDNAAYCNGNGACFDFDQASPMCPSYKATGNRVYSPKGRATLMREWLRLLAEQGVDPLIEAVRISKASKALGLIRRTINTLNPANRDDFSHEVRQAMDTCLACKACAGQCPVKVSVPAFRSKFLNLYHDRYLRPLKDPLIASIETMLPVMTRFRLLYNLIARSSIGRAAVRRVGLTALPALPAVSFARLANAQGVQVADPARIANMSEGERSRIVVLIPDAFTLHFDPMVGVAALEVARLLGLEPLIAPTFVNGKALHVHGYLDRFAYTAERTSAYLNEFAATGVSMVGLDPSMTLVFRSEYLVNGRAMPTVLLPQEWLIKLTPLIEREMKGTSEERFRLIPHCTERTNAPTSSSQWKTVFRAFGLELEIANAGCCGMAGTFGHETRNRELSEKLYEMSWAEQIRTANSGVVVMATGYSCRSQVKEIEHKLIPHPLEVIRDLLREKQASPN